MSEKRDIQISKALSYLLRHGAVKERLNIDSDGYVTLSEILQHNRIKTHKATVEDIQRIVDNNDKKRFDVRKRESDGSLLICATQGHSLKTITNNNLQLLNDGEYPEYLIHGTTKKNLQLILGSGGLSKMNRNHIHFTSKLISDEASVSGLRNFSTVLIFLDVSKIQQNGIKFYKSLNDVYLSEGIDGVIPTSFFSKIVDRSSGKELEIL
jgi:2'-phosphotransferase